jgi:Asp-tRNA(Asn)/Glu-tRNA(Gln) amidotransferase C subunit
MSDDRFEALVAYVRATTELAKMPLSEERVQAVATVMTRIAGFAANIEAFGLGDDVEIAGAFTR